MAGTERSSEPSQQGKPRIFQLLKVAAKRALEDGDPWAKHNLHEIPAERIVRHLYHPETQTWSTDETIVKIESEPFTHGAMRFCYRMKKRAQPPKTATNRGYHRIGWRFALNYVAKAYQKDGVIDTSEEAKMAVQNDIMLQYEAQHWAKRFNDSDPPSKIAFIRAYAISFPDRDGEPWLAVERYIAGTDRYGAAFVKHNTNAGFVDTDLRRVTPQVFSAHSFYASEGQRLVADIQGVGDLYTDPQVLSSDYRFGDGDLGPRGMALFFRFFRHSGVSDALGIPIFPLSRNELKHQSKYEEDEETVSDEEMSIEGMLNSFQKLDANRIRRQSILITPKDIVPPESQDTAKQANLAISRADVSRSVRTSLRISAKPPKLRRSSSDVDEVSVCLNRAKQDLKFTHRNYHRKSSGELIERRFKSPESKNTDDIRRTMNVRTVSAPILPSKETVKNLSKVHYQLAVLHGMGRFPEVVPENHNDDLENLPDHDVFSVLFHLSYAAALNSAPACLALARVQASLDTCVSPLLKLIVPANFDNAKDMLLRAMASPYPPTAPKAAAGCLLHQILLDESHVLSQEERASDNILIQVLTETLQLLEMVDREKHEVTKHKEKKPGMAGTFSFQKGDRVEADFAMEGSYYSATVEDLSEDGEYITVRYDDDGSCERLAKQHVKILVPPTATQTNLGGPLSDEEAFGSEGVASDDQFLLEGYVLKAELAELKERMGERTEASTLYEQAADGAIEAGKMKSATQWSLKASELVG